MIWSRRFAFGLLVVASMLTASCASVRFGEDLADYAEAIEDLEQQDPGSRLFQSRSLLCHLYRSIR